MGSLIHSSEREAQNLIKMVYRTLLLTCMIGASSIKAGLFRSWMDSRSRGNLCPGEDHNPKIRQQLEILRSKEATQFITWQEFRSLNFCFEHDCDYEQFAERAENLYGKKYFGKKFRHLKNGKNVLFGEEISNTDHWQHLR